MLGDEVIVSKEAKLHQFFSGEGERGECGLLNGGCLV